MGDICVQCGKPADCELVIREAPDANGKRIESVFPKCRQHRWAVREDWDIHNAKLPANQL